MRLTPEERAAIRARAEAATPGEWRLLSPYSGGSIVANCERAIVLFNPSGNPHNSCMKADSDFVANARQDVPALLADLEAADAALAALREENARLRKPPQFHDVEEYYRE